MSLMKSSARFLCAAKSSDSASDPRASGSDSFLSEWHLRLRHELHSIYFSFCFIIIKSRSPHLPAALIKKPSARYLPRPPPCPKAAPQPLRQQPPHLLLLQSRQTQMPHPHHHSSCSMELHWLLPTKDLPYHLPLRVKQEQGLEREFSRLRGRWVQKTKQQGPEEQLQARPKREERHLFEAELQQPRSQKHSLEDRPRELVLVLLLQNQIHC